MNEETKTMPTSGVSSKIERKVETTPYISDLPVAYGDTKIVLLPRDPWWCFTYWEIAEDTLKEIKSLYGESVAYVIRVYDVTNVPNFDGKNANKYFDINISLQTNNWYINLPEPNRSWCVDLGIKTSDGKFIVIARSNIVIMPRFGVSPITDEQWAVLQREFERLLELSGVQMIGKGSFDIAKLMRERWEELIAISQIPQFISSGFVSSFAQRQKEAPVPKEFYLKADTELIVYGETLPDAKLYINGDEFKLTADGRFSLRMNLPDGEKVIPIKAVSADGTMEKQIIFVVNRKSEYKG
ncbi:MAG: DUF4912 domain-containing protein [Endomicrobia bacterium]|nr:DUF4912 domain-containing protein [Endomicrobiia bacterium]MCX7716741.1 DUF4912 domain-containing protein [Endomicrobiia bacterium]